MKIEVISDLHGFLPELPGGNLLIVAWDCTASDKPHEVIKFGLWVNEQKYKKKIVIAGNHDNMIQTTPRIFEGLPDFVLTYLCDSGTEFTYNDPRFPEEDEGFLPSGKRTLKIWGSPWVKSFPGMNPKAKAFTVDTEEELGEKWALIPDDIDILITHGPSKGILDLNCRGESCGSCSLYLEVKKAKPKYHVFGHIHEQGGQQGNFINDGHITKCINCSLMNECYKPVHMPVRIRWPL